MKQVAPELLTKRAADRLRIRSGNADEVASVVEFRDDPHHLFELEFRERVVEPVVEVGDHLDGRSEERDAANLVAPGAIGDQIEDVGGDVPFIDERSVSVARPDRVTLRDAVAVDFDPVDPATRRRCIRVRATARA